MQLSDYPEALAALGLVSVRMAECIKITREDNTIYRFTGYSENIYLPEPYDLDVGMSYIGTPTTSQLLGTVNVPNETVFPANFAGAYGSLFVKPIAPYVIDVKDDGVNIGTITISISGVFSFATVGGLAITVAAGSDITFVGNAVVDAALRNPVATLIGVVTPYFWYERADSFDITALEMTDGLAVSNMDINCIISDDRLTSGDLFAGLFDSAKVELVIAAWDAGGIIRRLPLRVSWMGETVTRGISFKADLRGVSQQLSQVFTTLTSLECRNVFGDAKCQVNLAPYTIATTVAAVDSSRTQVQLTADTSSRNFRYGKVVFITGQCAGLTMEIIKHVNDTITLFLPPERLITVGDSVSVTEGCSRVLDQCGIYGNTVRFNGEPFLEGSDIFGRYPNAVKK